MARRVVALFVRRPPQGWPVPDAGGAADRGAKYSGGIPEVSGPLITGRRVVSAPSAAVEVMVLELSPEGPRRLAGAGLQVPAKGRPLPMGTPRPSGGRRVDC